MPRPLLTWRLEYYDEESRRRTAFAEGRDPDEVIGPYVRNPLITILKVRPVVQTPKD